MARYIEELVSQQVRKSELARRKSKADGQPCAGLVVTISRRMGSGARVIADKLAHDLGWSLWDKELIEAIAQDADVSRRVVEAFDERTISEIELVARAFLGDQEMGGFIYARHLAHALAAISKLGCAIILGRGANFMLRDALNVRIDASDEVRIRNMMQFEGLTHEQAEHKIRRSDRDREHFLTSVYGKERVQHARFDLDICTDRWTPDDATEIIKTAIAARRRAGAK
ncbi:MAG: cytidylate kinase-like family protein [Armatimonadetes bacterium]|nr:cytidylate kinase-like family protein [Armatimonadota bacterium]